MIRKLSTCFLLSLIPFAAIVVGCRYDCTSPDGDVVDYIIRGDARRAAKKCIYPLRINLSPLISDISDEADFVRRFPIVFDKEARRKLAELKKERGWGFQNWQGGCFGNGELWREYDGDRLSVVNLTSATLFDYWQKKFRRSLLTLAPKYRQGCVWDAYYFISEDDAYFGRVDSLGEPWTRPGVKPLNGIEPGVKVSDRFRIMLFKRGQKTNDEPYRVFYYDAKDDPKFAGRHAGEISSPKGGFSFGYNTVRNEEMPEMDLTFDIKPGKELFLRLKKCTWPPPNAGK